MHHRDLELLRQKYAHPSTDTGVLIQMELENIARLCEQCDGPQRQFSAAIVDKFCRVIQLMDQENEWLLACADNRLQEACEREKGVLQYVAAPAAVTQTASPDPISFSSADDLLRAFYNHFRTAEQREADYREIPFILANVGRMKEDLIYVEDAASKQQLEDAVKSEMKKVNLTMKDYAARVKTFAKRYLDAMLADGVLGCTELTEDRVLFTYRNIELILARFDTKEDGQINKQKSNICSALRKLNQFKRETER